MTETQREYQNRRGLIYFIKAKGIDLWKVGFCSDISKLKTRIRMIQTYCPFDVELKAISRHKKYHNEKQLHSEMFHHRVRGEWFTLNRCIEAHIMQYEAEKKYEEENKA
jgi:hypothetical protein